MIETYILLYHWLQEIYNVLRTQPSSTPLNISDYIERGQLQISIENLCTALRFTMADPLTMNVPVVEKLIDKRILPILLMN